MVQEQNFIALFCHFLLQLGVFLFYKVLLQTLVYPATFAAPVGEVASTIYNLTEIQVIELVSEKCTT